MLTVFDSGVGGLTVLREVRKVYKGPILYLGDTLRAPYGNRNEEELIRYMKELISYGRKQKATHFVNACNSLSAQMTKELLEEIGIESSFYTDMLRATEKYFPRESYNELFLLATQATIRSGSYRHFFSFLSYHELALPALASAIESGEEDEIAQALLPLQKESAGGALFLGCTHFPLVAEEIVRLSGGEVIDPAIFVREVVKKWDKGETGNIVAHLSGETAVFEKFIKQYLPGEEYELCKASFGGNS